MPSIDVCLYVSDEFEERRKGHEILQKYKISYHTIPAHQVLPEVRHGNRWYGGHNRGHSGLEGIEEFAKQYRQDNPLPDCFKD